RSSVPARPDGSQSAALADLKVRPPKDTRPAAPVCAAPEALGHAPAARSPQPAAFIIVLMAQPLRLHRTVPVRVGHVQVGAGAQIVVQSMTMTDTADAVTTAAQCVELAEAGSDDRRH